MDTQKLKETLQIDLDWLARTRDELRLQTHLAKAETRSELNKLESTWQRVQDELRRVGEQTKGQAVELGGTARNMLEELAQGYGRIKRELEDAGLNDVASRSVSAFQAATSRRDSDQLRAPMVDAERASVDSPLVRVLERVAAQIGGHADVRSVFASPVTKDGVTVIPVARVFAGFGGGGSQESGAPAAGMGVGGGFGAQPVGFIEIDRDGARFRRIDDSMDSWFGAAGVAFDLLRRSARWLAARKRERANAR